MAKAAKFDQGYTVTAEGDQKVVSFMGDGLPWSGYIMFPIFYMVAIGFLFSPLWQLSLAAGGAVGYLIYLMYQRQTFIISPDGIIKKSVKYEAEKISEIFRQRDNILGQPFFIRQATWHLALRRTMLAECAANLTAFGSRRTALLFLRCSAPP